MKNIHVLPTDKPSRLFYNVGGALLFTNYENHNGVNIYITSDEEIKEGDWYISILENEVYKATKETQNIMSVANLIGTTSYKKTHFKIILTTDQDLIKNGVQAIDDEFLEWFVNNPSCEYVTVEDYANLYNFRYLILLPKEETKQDEIDFMANELVIEKERMYSEEEVLNFTQTMIQQYKFGNTNIEKLGLLKETLQIFKKK